MDKINNFKEGIKRSNQVIDDIMFLYIRTSVTSSHSRVTVTWRKTANLGENIKSVTNSWPTPRGQVN